MKLPKKMLTLLAIIGFILGWSLLLYHFPPREIVNSLGAENSLLIAFLVASFGGVSTVTSVNYYATVLTLAAGGTSPVLLGICAGAGITVGDSLFYYLGTQSHDALSGKAHKWASRLARWIRSKQEWWVQVFVFAYTGLTPLPNDVLTVSLGLAEFSYKRLLPALLLGNITLTIIIAEFASQSGLIQRIFGV